MSRAGRSAAALGALAVVFGVIYLLGALPLGLTLRVGGAAAGLLAVVSVASALPLEDRGREEGEEPPWRVVARTGRLRRFGRRLSSKVGSDPADTATERLVRIAQTSAADFESLLRPRLAAVTGRRVRRAGYDPSDLESLQQLLGPLAGRVLTTSRSHDPRGPGVEASEVAAFLENLKELT